LQKKDMRSALSGENRSIDARHIPFASTLVERTFDGEIRMKAAAPVAQVTIDKNIVTPR